MKILIVGSKGFIGSHVLQYYMAGNHDVWGCGVSVDYRAERYFNVNGSNADFDEIFQTVPFDLCVNCSGAASVPDSLIHTHRDFMLNTVNVLRLLDAIRKYAPNCKFVNMSSAAIYGNPERLPIVETQQCAPVSPYGYHKLMSENICKEYAHLFGIQTSSLRIFSAYGPGLYKQLLWDVTKKIKASNGTPISFFGTGEETRDFIYIEDLVNVIALIANIDGNRGAVYNVGNGVAIPIKNVIFEIASQMQFAGAITFSGNERQGDPIHWCADISQIQTLGYKQTVQLDAGIKKYIQWIDNDLK